MAASTSPQLPERISRVFRPGGSLEEERVNGFGVGLSIVVQLLAQIGGRLEVMTPADGTTFWAFIPTELAPPAAPRLHQTSDDAGADRLFRQNVRIHAAN